MLGDLMDTCVSFITQWGTLGIYLGVLFIANAVVAYVKNNN